MKFRIIIIFPDIDMQCTKDFDDYKIAKNHFYKQINKLENGKFNYEITLYKYNPKTA